MSPAPGVRLIVLDGYDISFSWPAGTKRGDMARAMLSEARAGCGDDNVNRYTMSTVDHTISRIDHTISMVDDTILIVDNTFSIIDHTISMVDNTISIVDRFHMY